MIKWFDIAEYKDRFKPSSFFIGGRGIGKTYSALGYFIEIGEKFIYLRNTITQLDECCGNFGNPFKKWAKDHNRIIYMKKEKSHAIIYEDKDGEVEEIGYGAALSSFDSLRGVDLSDVKFALFDEFIEKKTLNFDQFKAYDDFYETVNHNRDLLGEDPFKIILLSNAQKLANKILAGKDLIGVIEKMMISNQKCWSNNSVLICMAYSEVSELKKQTAFYKDMDKNSRTYKEALENKFANDSFYGVKKRPLREYVGICRIDEIYLYRHKSNGKYYACMTQCINVPEYDTKGNFGLFYRTFGQTLDRSYGIGALEFSDFTTKTRLLEILRI